ncbi:kinase-like domain-containing protein [Mycena vulgaris]|nr:kinase-like domain-containing protein [Mycena vulgaris]
MLPSALFITGVSGREEYPTYGGGYGDVYRASYDNEAVALKHMRHFLRGSDSSRIRLTFCREALVWRELHHPNILRFIGISRESFPASLCMVSPWMEHGTVLEYLKSHGRENVDKLLFEIAQGLQHLHSCNIVHGDLRGANILINQYRSACLADFGLSAFSNATSSMRTSTRAGSLYWMAPELIYPERFGHRFARTPATDVYAFGCVCVELYTGRPPFSELAEPAVLLKVVDGERAERPSGTPAMSHALWRQVNLYWEQRAASRPVAQLVVQNMARLAQTRSKTLRRLPPLPGNARNSWAPDEDIQQLFTTCEIGVENATLLLQALVMTAPGDLTNTFITEFHEICTTFQKHISGQIPWVSARAERSRLVKDREEREKGWGRSDRDGIGRNLASSMRELTREEELLAELLSANEELIEVLNIYNDQHLAIDGGAEVLARSMLSFVL